MSPSTAPTRERPGPIAAVVVPSRPSLSRGRVDREPSDVGPMATRVPRRTVASGAAWSVPVIAVSAPVPALAASGGCPVAVVASATAQQGGVTITIRISPDVPSYCVTSVNTVSAPRAITSWTTGCFDQIEGNNDSVILTGRGGDNAAARNYRGQYVIDVVLSLRGVSCPVQVVPFTAT